MPKVTMPQLGESVAEGTIGKWLKKPGDKVAKYEPIVEVITDKVNAEVPSPFEGTLTEILVQEGETVPNNAEIAVIEGTGEAAAETQTPEAAETKAAPTAEAKASEPAAEAKAAPPEAKAPEPGADEKAPEPAAEAKPAPAASATATNGRGDPDRTVLGMGGQGPAGSDERPAGTSTSATATAAPPADYEGRMTPAVRRLAREHEVDLSQVPGTGHAGRVTREDVLAFLEQQRSGAAAAPAQQPAPAGQAQAAPPAPGKSAVQAPPSAAPSQDELKPMTPMRKAIAAHMVQAKSTAPHAYTTVEVDMSGVVGLRESVKGRYQAQEGIALSYVAIVAKGLVEALERNRDLNAHWTDEGVLRRADINLGIAVAVDDGLIVPVIRRADEYSIHGLNLKIQDFAARARANQLKLDDIQGGTFTLNNTGWFGSVASQPIINVPEVAILSMEAIVKRPVVVEGPGGDAIAIRPMMNVCVSFDHRATDGAQVGRFVQEVRRWLESVDSDTPVW
jgi:pyruvate/2-oxoglutarate dehydrogenase complex dihydrolipoamide acyltransferase (E2) component